MCLGGRFSPASGYGKNGSREPDGEGFFTVLIIKVPGDFHSLQIIRRRRKLMSKVAKTCFHRTDF